MITRHRERIVTGLALSAALAWTAARTCAADLPADETERYLQAMASHVTTLRATFQIASDGNAPRTVRLAWDRGGDRVNATVLYPSAPEQHNPIVRQWVRSTTTEWEAHPEYDPESPGTWIVDMAKPGQTAVAQEVNEGEFGLRFLSEALTPYHLRQPEALANAPDNYRMTATEARAEDGRLLRTYTGYLDGTVYDRATYLIDDSEHFRLDAVTYQELSDGKLRTYFEGAYSGHQAVGPMAIPMKIVERHFEPTGKVSGETTVVFEEVEVNVPLADEVFVYKPPHGSRVHDRISGVTYRAGYSDPMAALGRDEDVFAVNEKLLVGAPLQSAASAEQPVKSIQGHRGADSDSGGSVSSAWAVEPRPAGGATAAATPDSGRAYVLWGAVALVVVLIGGGAAGIKMSKSAARGRKVQ